MDRATARQEPPRFYLRRLTILLVFGLLHGVLLWSGDILAPYALMGFALYLFRNRSQKTVAWWAAALYVWPLIPLLAGAIASVAGFPVPAPEKITPQEIARIVQVYSTGSYAGIVQEHLHELAFQALGLLFFYPRILGLFLAGLWVWRAGVVSTIADRTEWMRRCQRRGLAVGLVGNAVMVAIGEIWHPDPMSMGPLVFAMNVAGSIGVPAMSLFYASTLALAWEHSETWRRRLRPFGAVGRTALTNYLVQTVVCTALFNSWGLGLFGRVSPLAGLIPTVLLYGAQLAASTWYIARFGFGPMEWLWRILTYGRVTERPTLATSAQA